MICGGRRQSYRLERQVAGHLSVPRIWGIRGILGILGIRVHRQSLGLVVEGFKVFGARRARALGKPRLFFGCCLVLFAIFSLISLGIYRSA